MKDLDGAHTALLNAKHVQLRCKWIYYYRYIADSRAQYKPLLDPPPDGTGAYTPLALVYDLFQRWVKGAPAAGTLASSAGVLNLGNDSVGTAVAVQGDGKTLVLSDDGVRRYDKKGKLDPTYGINGFAALSLIGKTLSLQSDGNLIVAGNQNDVADSAAHGYHLAVIRLSNLGQVDTSFGSGGTFALPDGSDSTALSVALCRQDRGRRHDQWRQGRRRHSFGPDRNTRRNVWRAGSCHAREPGTDDRRRDRKERSNHRASEPLSTRAGDVRRPFQKQRRPRQDILQERRHRSPARHRRRPVCRSRRHGVAGRPRADWRTRRARAYTPAGNLDATFGTGGIEALASKSYLRGNTIEWSDGSRYIYGSIATTLTSDAKHIYVSKLSADDQIDPTFGVKGVMTLSSTNIQDLSFAGAANPDGTLTILAGAFTQHGENGSLQELFHAPAS